MNADQLAFTKAWTGPANERYFAELSRLGGVDERRGAPSAVDPASDDATRTNAAPRRDDRNDRNDQSWPAPLADAALHGLAGDYLAAVEPYSEADRPALLIHFLVAAGIMLGSRTFAIAGDAVHPPRLQAVVVGETSKGRKGSALRPVERLLHLAGFPVPIAEGLSSGEGLIWAVRDPIERYERTGRGAERATELVLADPGVEDKRLLVAEAEYASVLRVIEREGNTLSAVIRRAWDSGELRTLTKNSPAVATGAHIGIIGHCTRDEIRRYLNRTELAAGFANRTLWIAARRARLLPDGEAVPETALRPVADALATAAVWAEDGYTLHRDDAAAERWRAVYGGLSAGRPGMLGAATNRAEAQVLRLSVLYAALDRSPVIRREHLDAALALWGYAFDSAAWIFGSAVGDPLADELLAALARGPLTRTEIRDLFGRNQSGTRIDVVLGRLLSDGHLIHWSEETGGRPREVWGVSSFRSYLSSPRSRPVPPDASGAGVADGLAGPPGAWDPRLHDEDPQVEAWLAAPPSGGAP